MITKEEYGILKQHKEVLVRWSQGYKVSLDRVQWDALAPVVRKYGFPVGQRGCGACILNLCKHAYTLLSEFEENNKKNGKKVKE